MGASGLSNVVNALAFYNSDLYACGGFTNSGSTVLNRVGKWNGTAWQAVDGGVSGPAYAMAAYNGDLYVFGNFASAGAQTVSNWARFRESVPPSITGQPQPVVITAFQFNASFEVMAASPTGLSYQWRRNGVPISDGAGGATPGGGQVSGAHTSRVTITLPAWTDAGLYDCVVTNTCGSVTSMSASLTLPDACRADVNASGTISVQDIFDFVALYFANDPRADYNRSGVVSVQDLFDFLAGYFGGCA